MLALSGSQRSAQFPGVGTFREQGIDIDAVAWFGLFGPAGMPRATVEKLNAALQVALKTADVADRLEKLGLSVAPGSADDMARRLAADKAMWNPVIRASGFQAD